MLSPLGHVPAQKTKLECMDDWNALKNSYKSRLSVEELVWLYELYSRIKALSREQVLPLCIEVVEHLYQWSPEVLPFFA